MERQEHPCGPPTVPDTQLFDRYRMELRPKGATSRQYFTWVSIHRGTQEASSPTVHIGPNRCAPITVQLARVG